jgi:predicted RNA-binding Zn ribbon-like protein
MNQTRSTQPFLFVGNHACLDFINTEMIIEGQRTDLLETPADLFNWSMRASLLDANEERAMRTGLAPAEREKFLRESKAFRGVLREMAERIVTNKPVTRSTTEEINRLLSQRPGYTQLLRTNGRFEHRFYSSTKGPVQLPALLAESASDLLCASKFSLIKKCRNDACILYFYDTTKNHARQWCSMNICGNRMKVAAHYRRQRRGTERD